MQLTRFLIYDTYIYMSKNISYSPADRGIRLSTVQPGKKFRHLYRKYKKHHSTDTMVFGDICTLRYARPNLARITPRFRKLENVKIK